MTRFVYGLLISATVALAAGAGDEPHAGLDFGGFDRKVRPQDDLFTHANGRWLLTTEIPKDKSNYGTFTRLADAARENVRAIIEAEAREPQDENGRKIGAFYKSYMDEELIEKKGIDPLQEELSKIDKLASQNELVAYFGRADRLGIGSPAGFGIGVDDKDSSRYLAEVGQRGLTLPDRDYYLEDKEAYRNAREKLRAYVARLFELARLPGGADAAESILKLETALAEVHWSRTELRDAEKRYNLFRVADLGKLTPEFPWKTFFAATDAPQLEEVNVSTPSFFQGLERILGHTDLETWKQYQRFRLLDAAAPFLPKDFVQAHFELHEQAISGVPEQKPRWQRAVDALSGSGPGDFGVLGDALGRLYVKKHFPPESRKQMNELVGNLLKTYDTSIRGLTWMTEPTKKRALEKLVKMVTKIGYPDQWRDYSSLEIKADDLWGNMRRSAEFELKRLLARLHLPVDRGEWGMTPQTVNAYYNPSLNEIVFPAAILQPPFFDPGAENAVNYGGIGAVIGHEISHAFDDQGSRYDAQGNLSNWWTDADRKAFEELTSRLVAQAEQFEPLSGRSLNGKLTLGENIADLSGMTISYKAYQLSLGSGEGPVMDGYTASQRFFLGWAQIWRRKYRDDELARRLVVDPHAPSQFRANGPVSNFDPFYKAFLLKPGDKLYRPKQERIQIW